MTKDYLKHIPKYRLQELSHWYHTLILHNQYPEMLPDYMQRLSLIRGVLSRK